MLWLAILVPSIHRMGPHQDTSIDRTDPDRVREGAHLSSLKLKLGERHSNQIRVGHTFQILSVVLLGGPEKLMWSGGSFHHFEVRLRMLPRWAKVVVKSQCLLLQVDGQIKIWVVGGFNMISSDLWLFLNQNGVFLEPTIDWFMLVPSHHSESKQLQSQRFT